MEYLEFTAGPNDNDRRLDKIIRFFIKDVSLSEIYKAIRKGLIKINKKKCKPETHVFNGDIISIASFLVDNAKSNPEINEEDKNNDFEIIFENEHLLVLNKPYDTNVHGDGKSLEKKVFNYFKKSKANTSLSFTPGPLHRLDKKTTGLLAFSMSIDGARWFSENIKKHSIHKIYYSIFEGNIDSEQIWEDVITNQNEDTQGFYKVTASSQVIDETSKKAITKVYPLQLGNFQGKSVTFVKIHILTGRKHQIRAQSSLHKHPVLGDSAYGSSIKLTQGQAFYLHAGCLNLPENELGFPLELKASLPENFCQFLKCCGINKIEL